MLEGAGGPSESEWVYSTQMGRSDTYMDSFQKQTVRFLWLLNIFNRSSVKDCKNQIIHCHAEIESSPTSSSPLASSDPSDPFAEPNFLHSGLVMCHCQVHVHQCLNFDSLRLCSVPLPRPVSNSEDSSLIIYRGRQWLWLRYPVCPGIGTPRFECPPCAAPKSR